MQPRRDAAAEAQRSIFLQLSAAAGFQENTLRFLRRFGDEVDHAIDGVRAPQGASWAADHFDAIDVFQQRVLHVPVNARVERRVHRAPIHQDEEFVGQYIVEAARADSPLAGVDLRDLKIGSESKGFRDAGRSRAADVVA
jgi:hypothetical protein